MSPISTEGRVKPLVLVIDDSATYRAAIGQTLRDAGYEVATEATGDEGLRAAARLRPDVLVVDRVLPDVDGTAVIRNIRLDAALRRTPCLLITADEDPAVEFTALETGADAYVRKDEDFAVLLARVAALQRDTPARLRAAPSRERRRIVLVAPGRPAHLGNACALPVDEYEMVHIPDLHAAASALAASTVDCAVIVTEDLATGLTTLREVRDAARASHVPILVLQYADNPADAAELLTGGADDYVSCANGAALYTARLRALIRRKEAENEERAVTQSLLRHEAEAAAASVRAEVAERESEFKERFLALMSHELRTPLNAILGFAQILSHGVGGHLTPPQLKHIGGVMRSAEHLLAIVNDVLDLSKIRAGKLPLRMMQVRLDEVAETARITVGAIATQRDVALELDLPDDLPLVHGDPVRIQQILYNLLSNGLKFTPAGGTVTLSARADGEFVRMSVKDTGIGIPREDFPRLFRDFERLEHGQSQQAEGTGLGLSLTKHLVEQHRGRIEMQSEVGKGSTFSVWIPRADLPRPS